MRRFDSGTVTERSRRTAPVPAESQLHECDYRQPVEKVLENYTRVIHSGPHTATISSRQCLGGLSSAGLIALIVISAPHTRHL